MSSTTPRFSYQINYRPQSVYKFWTHIWDGRIELDYACSSTRWGAHLHCRWYIWQYKRTEKKTFKNQPKMYYL